MHAAHQQDREPRGRQAGTVSAFALRIVSALGAQNTWERKVEYPEGFLFLFL